VDVEERDSHAPVLLARKHAVGTAAAIELEELADCTVRVREERGGMLAAQPIGISTGPGGFAGSTFVADDKYERLAHLHILSKCCVVGYRP